MTRRVAFGVDAFDLFGRPIFETAQRGSSVQGKQQGRSSSQSSTPNRFFERVRGDTSVWNVFRDSRNCSDVNRVTWKLLPLGIAARVRGIHGVVASQQVPVIPKPTLAAVVRPNFLAQFGFFRREIVCVFRETLLAIEFRVDSCSQPVQPQTKSLLTRRQEFFCRGSSASRWRFFVIELLVRSTTVNARQHLSPRRKIGLDGFVQRIAKFGYVKGQRPKDWPPHGRVHRSRFFRGLSFSSLNVKFKNNGTRHSTCFEVHNGIRTVSIRLSFHFRRKRIETVQIPKRRKRYGAAQPGAQKPNS